MLFVAVIVVVQSAVLTLFKFLFEFLKLSIKGLISVSEIAYLLVQATVWVVFRILLSFFWVCLFYHCSLITEISV